MATQKTSIPLLRTKLHRPSVADDQYTAEIFYRFQLTQNLAITPDVQLIIDPALNPDESTIWIFGLRARLAL